MKKNLFFIFFNILPIFFCLTRTYGQSTFTNIAPSAGINHYHDLFIGFGGGVAFFDYNNDNLEDLYYTGGKNMDKLYRNNGDGTFTDVTIAAGFEFTDSVFTNGVVTGDIDNDGYRDLFLYTFWTHHSYLLRNNGDGTFTDISVSAGVHLDSSFAMGASFGDYDKDGFLDLYVANYVEVPNTVVDTMGNFVSFDHICAENKLYKNNGNNTFTDVSQFYGVDNAGCTLATTFTDYDDDGDLDIWSVNDFGEWVLPDALYQNNLPSGFNDVSVAANVALEIYGMGIAVGDYDQDMDLDYYITNIGGSVFHHNNGNGTFIDTAVGSGVWNKWVIPDSIHATGWGTGFMDIDNDSYLDLFVSNGYINAVPILATGIFDPDKLFRNNGNGTFSDISTLSGIDSTTISRGFAYGDYDNDGDIDLIPIPGYYGANSYDTINVPLYRNDLNNGYNWLKVKLQGTISNRDAFGAKILIYIAGKSWIHEVSGGNSHLSHVSSIAHFGLGTATIVDSLIIKWPNGMIERMYAVSPNQTLYLVEGLVTNSQKIDNKDFGFYISPNPASDNFLIVYQQKENSAVRLTIFNALGQIVWTKEELQQITGNYQIMIDSQSFENGLYFVNMEIGGKIWTEKLIIQRW